MIKDFPADLSKSAQLFERANNIFPSGISRTPAFYPPFPIYSAFGKGCRFTDVDGVERIDFANNFTAQIHGHAHPRIAEAIIQQVKQVTSTIAPTEHEIKLAELLQDRIPGVEQIKFGNSGTEAVIFAVKAARAYTGRTKIVKIEGGYHGQYDLIQHSMDSSHENWGDEKNPNVVPYDKASPKSLLNELIVLPSNNTEASKNILQEHSDEIAAVLVDPVPRSLAGEIHTKEYLEMLRRITREKEIILIFDEVITLRLGYHGWQEKIGVIPDLTVMGKIIGGGLPVGALGGTTDIMSVFSFEGGRQKVFHGGTFSANPVTMAAGYECMSLLTPEVFIELDGKGERLRNGLKEIVLDIGVDVQIKGIGSLTAIALTKKKYHDYRSFTLAAGADYMQRMFLLHKHFLNNGVLIMPQGLLAGSTPMTDSDIDFTLGAATKAFIAYKER